MRRTPAVATRLVATLTRSVYAKRVTFFIPANPDAALVDALVSVMTQNLNHLLLKLVTCFIYQRTRQFQSNF